MTRLIEWLLSLDNIRWGRDAPVFLKWEVHPPPWLVFACLLIAAGVVGAIYRKERGPIGRRAVLGLMRLGLLALVAALICGPSLVLERNRTEPSYVAVLVDRSQSMARQETYPGGELAAAAAKAAGLADAEGLASLSRLELVRRAFGSNDHAPIRKLLEKNRVQIATFAAEAEVRGTVSSIAEVDAAVGWLADVVPDGITTDLGRAIERTISLAQGRRLAAIVLASDGQATVSTSLKDVIDLARGRQIPIYPLRIGSPIAPVDVEIGPCRVDDTVYLYDVVSLSCEVRGTGLAQAGAVPVRVMEERTQHVAASVEAPLSPESPATVVEFRIKPARTGLTRYRIEAPVLPGEPVTDNNVEFVEINVLDARLRVLYVDGYPRYEYRYLKNALLREPTMEVSVLLLEADEQFVQEGSDPIRRFPETPEELGRYDVVLFGDVDPRSGWLTPSQVNMLLDFVGNEGNGFGLIAGERFAPHRFLGTSLEKLLPVRIDPEFHGQYDSTVSTGFRPTLTPEGRLAGVLRLAVGKATLQAAGPAGTAPAMIESLEANEVFESLPELFWVARTLGVRPGASVLLEHGGMRTRSGRAGGEEPMPVLVTGRYRAGRLLYQGTDDTWRWRRHRIGAAPVGELLHDAYWVQLIRLLSKPQAVAQDRRYELRTDRKVYDFGARVLVTADVHSPELLARFGEEVPILVEEPAANQDAAAVPLQRVEARRRGGEARVFEGAFTPSKPGRYVLRVEGVTPVAGERPVQVAIRVQAPDLESRRPEADHASLQRLADGSGGQMLDLDRLETGFAEIRDRSVQIPDDVVEPLWDSRLALLLFAGLITAEWITRKVFGLL